MPKNVLVPQIYLSPIAPPIAEQSMSFERTLFERLNGYFPGASTESDEWTIAFWFKRQDASIGGQTLWRATIGGNDFSHMVLLPSDQLRCEMRIANVIRAEFTTRKVFRDATNWYHIFMLFRPGTGTWQTFINGEIYLDFTVFTPVTNMAGYSWLDSTAEHTIGASLLGDAFSGHMADWHCVGGTGLGNPSPFFGAFDSGGTWERNAYAGGWGNHGFNLTFGRTVDLGEDFSGNANDFNAVGGLPIDSDNQHDDWMERNYCQLDANDHRTTGTISDGGLVNAGGVAAVTMRPDTGVWYYERNGVAVVFDTGVSGTFDPLLDAATYNFGQLPFDDVGPGGGELTLCSPNLPASAIADSRDFFAGITYNSNGTNPRTITNGSQGGIEHRNLTHRSDLVWVKNANALSSHLQAHRLRPPGAQVKLEISDIEETVNAQGTITALLDPGPGFDVDAGGVGDDNVNDNAGGAKFYGTISWHVERFAQNLPIIQMADNAEEETLNPASGNTDVTSSDLEIILEGADPEQEVGLRYQDVRIPQGATVVDARIQFETDDVNAGANDLLIFTEDIDDAPVFVDAAANFNITNRTKATPGISWVPAAWNVIQERAAAQLTPSFAARVQDVVDRVGWAAGNSLVTIFAKDPVGTVGEREAEAWNAVGGDADRNTAMLQVSWQESANDSGVSLFEYFGAGKIAQVMHGLGGVPEFVAVKRADGAASSWRLYHSLIQTALPAPEDGYLELDTTIAAVDLASIWNDTAPGATFLSLGADASVNAHEDQYIGMAMRSITGFSRAFRYVGNGSADGPMVYCGFKPRMVCIKAADQVSNWIMHQRGGGAGTLASSNTNPMLGEFVLNGTNQAGGLARDVDVYSNGFKVRDTNVDVNQNLAEYVGIAFAEAPFENTKAAK